MSGSKPPAVVDVDAYSGIPAALKANGVTTERPVLVCVGGAAGMDDDDGAAVRHLLQHSIAPLVDRRSGAVVDGGTDSGVMRMMGRARLASGCGFPLIGVAAAGTIRVPGASEPMSDAADVEPQHTLVVRVPGNDWGDETPWLSAVASAIAGTRASVTLLINGGRIALRDAQASLAAGRPLIVLAGTGRAADEIASARNGSTSEEDVSLVGAAPLTRIVDVHDSAAVLDAVFTALGDAELFQHGE